MIGSDDRVALAEFLHEFLEGRGVTVEVMELVSEIEKWSWRREYRRTEQGADLRRDEVRTMDGSYVFRDPATGERVKIYNGVKVPPGVKIWHEDYQR